VLLAFISFLDYNPYTFEPGGRDDSTYTDFVLYQSWKTCLIRYLYDTEQPELFTQYIHTYMLKNAHNIFDDLTRTEMYYPEGYYETKCFEIDLFYVDYGTLIYNIENIFRYIQSKELRDQELKDKENDENIMERSITLNLRDFVEQKNNCSFECDICFDTSEEVSNVMILECKHHFHHLCLLNHIQNNGNICPLCRRNITVPAQKRPLEDDDDEDGRRQGKEEHYVINPETKRRIKVGGRVYNNLMERGIILN
jgi:hypothetical protein